jgi:hypothetical protein
MTLSQIALKQTHERIVLLWVILQPGANALALKVYAHLGPDHPTLELSITKDIRGEHLPVDLDLNISDIGLEGYALLHGLFEARSRPGADGRSHKLMVERPQLDSRLKSSYFPFRRRVITTGLII